MQVVGNVISLGTGAAWLTVDYYYTSSGIFFLPTVHGMAALGKSFKKKHVITLTWPDGKDTSKKTSASNGFTINYDNKYKSFANYEGTVSATIKGNTSSVTLRSNQVPSAPGLSARYVNDNRAEIVVSNPGEKGVLVTSVNIERQANIASEEWQAIATININSNSAYSVTYTDQTTERGARYIYRAKANSSGGSSQWVYTGWYYTYPPDISNVGHVRNSNTTCTISFQRSGQDVDRELITGFVIQRSQNGGAWMDVAHIGAGAATAQTVTYQDKTCAPNNYYSYRVKPRNARGVAIHSYEEGGTEPTYNTPAAPNNVVAYMTSSNNGQLVFNNPANTATDLYVERSDDGGTTWTEIDTVDESQGVVTSYLDDSDISGGNVQYRLRNGRDGMAPAEMYSPYAYSNVMSTLRRPSAPTLTIPANGTPVNLDNGVITLSWVHNPNDGTPQEAAQIQYQINGTYVATITLGAVATYNLTLDPSRFSANDVVTWRVRTKGAHADYSDWSEYGDFNILTNPKIKFTAPDNGSTIENLPIGLSWTYEDDSGTLESLTLEIVKGVVTQASIDIPVGEGTSGEYSYSLKEFLFDNDTDYDLRVTAVSSSGLSSVDVISVQISYVYVIFTNALFADAVFDDETGHVALTLNANEAEVEPGDDVIDSPIDTAYLYRNINGERTLVGSDLGEGSQLEDLYAPVNVPVTYELLQIATTGEISVTSMEYTFNSNYWYVYWGYQHENIAKAIWDPSGDVSISRPEKEQIRYSGRKYPVTYDSQAIEETFGYSGIVEDRAELNNFIKMIRDGGQGIWKAGDGQCYDADFELSYSADYTQNHLRWSISLDVTRIEE